MELGEPIREREGTPRMSGSPKSWKQSPGARVEQLQLFKASFNGVKFSAPAEEAGMWPERPRRLL